MFKTYAVLAGALLLAAAFFYGMHVQAGFDAAAASKAVAKANARIGKADAATESRTLAAATHVQALQADSRALQERIARTPFQPPSSGENHEPKTPSLPTCHDPFADPAFRLLYDAGSRALPPPGEAGDLPATGGDAVAAPAGGVRGAGAGG